MFPAQFGEKIGIPIRQGKLQSATGITGSELAYFHAVVVYVEISGKGYKFNCYGGFMYSLDPIGLELLGRHGFFELFESVTFKHNANVVELVPVTPSNTQATPIQS